MSHLGPGSSLRVTSQWAEPRYDVMDGSGGVRALLDGLYPELRGRHDAPHRLLLLTRQRHLLLLTRQCVLHQRDLLDYIRHVLDLLHHSPQAPPLLSATCLKLRKVASYSAALHRKLRSDPCLYPLPSPATLDTTRNAPRVLLIMAVQAVLLTERYLLRVLRRVALRPAGATPDLCRALTAYNRAAADLSKQAGPLAELRPFCLSRVMEILAEGRGRALAGEVRRAWLEDLLETDLRGRSQEDLATRAADPAPQGPPSKLRLLLQEDRSHVTPVLHLLLGLDEKLWHKAGGAGDPALYSQYCARLWPALYSQVFHDASVGGRGPRTPPALLLLPAGGCARAVRILRGTLVSEDLGEPCVSLGRCLCRRLLSLRSLVAWDSALCQALSSALTDKCAAGGGGDHRAPGGHSRTAGVLVTLCQHLSRLQLTPSSAHQEPPRGDPLFSPPSVLSQEAVLSRCTVTLHLCDMWLRSHAHIFTASASLGQLVLITHGDLPVIGAQCRSLVAAVEDGGVLSSSSQAWCVKMRRSRDMLEGLAVSLPHALGSAWSRRAQDFFEHVMPPRRHWRGKLVTGPEPPPSEYAQAAVSELLAPLLDAVTPLCAEEQGAALRVALGALMGAWMGHILREKIKFSLQGALQLRSDFQSVQEELRCRDSSLPPEVIRSALTLPVFSQSDNAIVCLLQQPPRKTYLPPGGFSCCPPLCRVSVDSVSDSLQSLDSLERRAWSGGGARRGHTHHSYLPHSQRQWLSLRLHKTWNGLSLPWEGSEG